MHESEKSETHHQFREDDDNNKKLEKVQENSLYATQNTNMYRPLAISQTNATQKRKVHAETIPKK